MFNPRDDVVSTWQADPPMIDAHTFGIELWVQVENLPAYAWAHLLALLHKNHATLEPLQSASITGEGRHGALSLGEVVSAVPQDFRTDDSPFEWETVGAEKSRNISVDMLFRDPLDLGVRQRVEEDLSVWLQLIILGAFDLAFEEAGDLDPLGTVKSTSPYRIECFFQRHRGKPWIRTRCRATGPCGRNWGTMICHPILSRGSKNCWPSFASLPGKSMPMRC